VGANGRSYADPCGVARSLDLVGERWALLVVRELLLGPKRFSDLLDGLPNVSPNVLTQRLRQLIEHDVVRRRDLGAPTRVHLYELTGWGRGLEPALLALGRWGSQAPPPPAGEMGIDSLLLGLKATFDPALAKASHGTFEWRIDEDTFVLTVDGGGNTDGIDIVRGTAEAPPDARLSTDRGTLRSVCAGRRTVAAAVRSGDLVVSGEPRAVRRMTNLLDRLATAPVVTRSDL
jgi:DNA-binding HxlR family transcriptional regulator